MMTITAPHFCAGLVLEHGVVVRAAPILGYMKGWKAERVRGYALLRGWVVEVT
jgi:hypothetical protein